MKKLLALIFLSLVGYAAFAQAPTSVYWLKSRVDGSVPTPISGWGSLYFDYVTAKWKICNGTSCYDLPIGTTTRNNLPPSTHTSSFTLAPADTSKMHILSGGSGAIVITMGTFSGLGGKGLQFAFRRDRTDTVYFDDGSETIVQSPGATLGVADSTFAYLYYNGTTDKFYLANGGSGGGSSGGGGSGTVTSVSVTTANGVSGSVATATTTPAISLTLGAITPTSVNGVVVSGSSTPTLAVTGTTTVSGSHSGTSSGTNTGDQTTITGNAGTATALATGRTIGTLTGDATSAGSSFNGTANNTNAVTLATVNSNVGTFGSSTAIPQYTVNAKGLITASTTVAPQTASGSQPGFLSSTDWTTFNNKQAGDADLTDIAALSPSNDDFIQRKVGAWTNRTVAQVKTDLGISNVENTALSTWPGSTNLVTVGTITTGTWDASAISATKGGTAQTSWTTGQMLYASASNTLSKLSIGSTDQVLKVSGGIPSWGDVTVNLAYQYAISDEITFITTGTSKITFRMPHAFVLTDVRASLITAQTSGSIFTIDINESATTILSTKLTIDNTEKTSTTAATPVVISDANLADDAEITIDVDQIGSGTAIGCKITLIGHR